MRLDLGTRLTAMGVKPEDEEVPISTDGRINPMDDGPRRQLAACRDMGWRDGVIFEVTTELRQSDFCSFIEENSQEDVAGFFREVVCELDVKRGILDFHMKIKEEALRWFYVQVYYGDWHENVPKATVESRECISCIPGAALLPGQEPGVTAEERVLSEFSDQPHVKCSFDSKARAGFVIAPVRHAQRISQLQDEEVFALWSVAVRALRQDSLPFRIMTLNHGAYRNTPHLSLSDSGISLASIVHLGPKVPIFGVCMGLQCMGEAFGGKIVRARNGVVYGKTSPVFYDKKGEDGLMAGLPNPFVACRYHSLVIERESFPHEELEITAWTEDGLIMGIRHKKYRHIQGVQFHPESIITEDGKRIVANFVKMLDQAGADSHAKKEVQAIA